MGLLGGVGLVVARMLAPSTSAGVFAMGSANGETEGAEAAVLVRKPQIDLSSDGYALTVQLKSLPAARGQRTVAIPPRDAAREARRRPPAPL